MAAKNEPGVTARDVRNTALWREMEEHFLNVHGPGFGKITGASDPCPHPDGSKILFTGSMWAKLEDTPQTRICVVDTNTGAVTVATDGPNNDKLPKWSPDGQRVAFLSDRAEKGIFQLYIGGADELLKATPSSPAEGIVEYFDWCPQGTAILIGTAGLGADKAGADGSGDLATGSGDSDAVPAWMPEVHSKADDDAAWRTLWVCDAKGDGMRQVSRQGTNVWEAACCGPDHAITIASTAPGEEAWYTAKLVIMELRSGDERVLYESNRQLGLPASSPSGKLVAFAQAVCSDRGIIAGDILLIDPNSKDKSTTTLAIAGTDATQLTWRDENRLFYMGQRGLQTIAGEIDVTSKEVKEIWATSETCGYRYPRASPYAAEGVVAVCESWTRYPEIGIVSKGKYQTVVSLDQGGGQWLLSKIGAVEEVSWEAPDGLEIQGLLYLPKGRTGPCATVLNVHGGPVWAIRNWWGSTSQYVPLLVAQGYAVLCVNPRGSGGRGQDFAEKVYGDMGGADTDDFLSGLDELVARGIADPKRLGVTGGSYGGFISSWIITQSDRFAAAVALAPVTDWFGQHTTSNIPYFDQIFLNSDPYAPGGLYYERSPVRFAGRYPTPVLQVAGAKDRCTPPGNALQYHRALLEHGVESVLVTYPQEGHGVRKFPAFIDFSHRMLSWFGKHMPA